MIVLRHADAGSLWLRVSAWLWVAGLVGVTFSVPIDVRGSVPVPAYAGMTAAYAGMTAAYAGMTAAYAGMTAAYAGMTTAYAGMTTAQAAITVAGEGGPAEPGGQATYTLRLLNWTDHPQAGAVISYTLPAGFTYVPGSTRVSTGGDTRSTADPAVSGATLGWGPLRLPAAGHTVHTPRGIHTAVQDLCVPEFLDLHMDQARALAGTGGYVTQLFYRITAATTAPDACAVAFLNAAYDRNLVPILRLQGTLNAAGYWDRPDPGPRGDYGPVAAGFARYVAGLPRRDSHPLYIAVWNEPNLWTEWSNAPDAVEYARFFVAVSKAVRGLNDPRIRILNGAVAPGNWKDAQRFIRAMLSVPGFVDAFDAWASHCYPYNHPPWYNLHLGTAKYPNTAIDCYVLERDLIDEYGGRRGFKFILTETGYALDDKTYGFEGFARIDETNRADYMRDAFSRFWPAWPGVIAVTPFLLGDPWNGWESYDWIDYDVSLAPPRLAFTLRPQYTAVATLSQPRGQTVPHGIEVTFRVRADDGATPGVRAGRLCGQAGEVAPVCADVAMRVVERVWQAYMPAVSRSAPAAGGPQGVWYLGAPREGGPADDGGITPTAFLTVTGDLPARVAAPDAAAAAIAVPGRPHVVAWADGASPGRVYVGTQAGQLAVVDLAARRVVTRTALGFVPQALAVGPAPDSVYVAPDAGDIRLIDVAGGATRGRTAVPLERPRGMVFDPAGDALLVADAGAGAIVRFSADLSRRLAVQVLSDLPDQVFLDRARGRLLVVLPGAGRVTALDAATLRPLQETGLPGGPVLAAALDGTRGRLYVLSAASPRRGIVAVLDTADLSRLALVAGTPAAPLQRASALSAGGGRLWIAEGDRLYGISGDGFGVRAVAAIEAPLGPAMLAADPAGGGVVWADEQGLWEYN